MAMVKGAIFDVDGVLLDSLGIWDDLGGVYLQSIQVTPEKGLNTILFSMSMEQGAAYLREHYLLPQSEEEILDGIKKLLENYYFTQVPAKPGAKEMMRFLKDRGIKMVLATSSPRLHVEKALERTGLGAFPERIFTTGETGISKHEPDIFDLGAAYLGTAPGETIVMEDSLYALKTAKEAGYITIGVLDEKGEPNQEGIKAAGDYTLMELWEFPMVFQRIEEKGKLKSGRKGNDEHSINDCRK